MGAKRWQLWLIPALILTGVVGVSQVFYEPRSVEAVTVVGGGASPSTRLPEQSPQAMQLPAWQPSGGESRSSSAHRETSVANATAATTETSALAQSTVPTIAASTTAAAVVSGEAVSTTPAATSRAKATTTQPNATVTTPKATAATSSVRKSQTATARPATS